MVADLLPTVGPAWAQGVETVGAVIVAIGIIWKVPGLVWRRLLVPMSKGVVQVSDVSTAAPLLLDLAQLKPQLDQIAKATPALVRVADMAPTLEIIVGEFTPNGGSSMKDAITSVRVGQDAIRADLRRVSKLTALHSRQLNTLEAHAQVITTQGVEAKDAATRRSSAADSAALEARTAANRRGLKFSPWEVANEGDYRDGDEED